MAEALYRKYRPQIFEDVVGQEHIERTIKNAIEQDKVSHAYLFTGPRGTGKTTTARLLAKALLCECGPTSEPDGTCDDCVMIANGEHPDVYELDAASRTGVENVREEIIGRVQFAPTRGRYKIYIIDEVHMLSTAAFNALLKTLEEPPSHVVFILATTDPQKVPETIHSRCQRFDFRRISAESIVSRLGAICVSEDVEFEGEALDLIAHRAEGGMRNALTSLEQLIAFGEGKVTMEVAERLLGSIDTNDLAEIVRAIGTRDVASCFRWTAEYVETGADLAQFARDLAEHMRNMYVLSLAGAMLGYTVLSSESPYEAAEQGVFIKAFAKTNKKGAPIVTLVVTNVIIEAFLVVMLFSDSTYQFFYALSAGMILLPYLLSAAYFAKLTFTEPDAFKGKVGGSLVLWRIFGVFGVVYSFFLAWASGATGLTLMSLLYAPGILMYIKGKKERNEPYLKSTVDKVVVAIILIAAVTSLVLLFTGQVVL